jgi:uncharacterized protein (DUF1015 family)
MATLHSFRAIRPSRDKAHLVVTRPVSTYSKSVLKAKLESNPYSFIRIIHPEFDKQIPQTNPNSKERFELVRSKYHEFIEEGIVFQDEIPHLYLYKQSTPTHEFLGIIGGASVEEYQQDKIKKHEATLTTREAMFTDYLDVVGYNAEPVLLSYPSNETLEDIYAKISSERPEYEFSTTDRTKHELWVLTLEEEALVKAEFAKIEASYIADGHHRSASSAGLSNRRKTAGIHSMSSDYFLAFFMDEKRLNIREFNRLVDNLNGLSEHAFLEKLKEKFIVTHLEQACKPEQEHHITMNLSGTWYLLICKPELYNTTDPVACLDPEILTQTILTPILGIEDLKTSASIQFIPGNIGLDAISTPISQGKAKVGFVLYPVTMNQVKKVADHQLIMPPKSTWVEPKLRSGLTIYEIEK